MRFSAVLQLHGKTATGIEVPDEVVEALGGGRRPAVRVTIGGHTYASTIARMGGVHLLPVARENREAAGIEAGQELDVEVTLDAAPRQIDIPEDLATALAAEPGLREAFDALAASQRKDHARTVTDAKTAATRERRLAKVLDAARAKRAVLDA